jgi:TonB family protein
MKQGSSAMRCRKTFLYSLTAGLFAFASLDSAYAAEPDQAADIAAAEKVALAYAKATANEQWDEAVSYLSEDAIKQFLAPVYSDPPDGAKKVDELKMMMLFGGSYGEVTIEHLRRVPEKDLVIMLMQGMEKSFHKMGFDYKVGEPVILKSTIRDPLTVNVEMLEKESIEGVEKEWQSVWSFVKENGAWKLDPSQSSKAEMDQETKAKILRKMSEKKPKEEVPCESKLTNPAVSAYKNLNENFPENYGGKARVNFYNMCYAGDFKKEKPDGKGIYIFPDGAEYAGEVRQALPHGTGRFLDETGWAYEGVWKDGMPVAGKCSYKGNTVACEVIDKYKPIYLWRPYQKLLPLEVSSYFSGWTQNYDTLVNDIRSGLMKQISKRTATVSSGGITRSLITSGVTRGSGGINTAALSSDVAGSGLGSDPGEAKLGKQAKVAVQKRDTCKAPDASSISKSRTDQAIQDVFDCNKSALYSLYQRALRHDPTLKGKLVLRITIAPSGQVMAVSVESSEFGDPELESKIAERIKRFDFGKVEQTEPLTITYPITFLPA